MCLDPVVVSFSANLLCGSLACRPGQQNFANVESSRWGLCWWAGAAWHSHPSTGQCQDWVCVSKWQLLPAAAPATAHGFTAFIAAGWRAAENGPLHLLPWEGFKELLQRARSTDMGCSERRRLKKRDQSSSFPKCPSCPGSHFQNRCTPWASAGLRLNERRWELVGMLHPSVNVLSLESSWDTPGEVEGYAELSGRDAASAGSCCIPPGASQHHDKQCHWGTRPLSPLSPLPWEGAARAKWNLADTESERKVAIEGKKLYGKLTLYGWQSWNCRNHLSHWDWTRYHVQKRITAKSQPHPGFVNTFMLY